MNKSLSHFWLHIEEYSIGSELPEDISSWVIEREGEFKYFAEAALSISSKLVWKATDELAQQRNAKFRAEFSSGISDAYSHEAVVLKFAPDSMGELRTKTENEWSAMKVLGEVKHPSARHFLAPLNYVHPNTCAYQTELSDKLTWQRLGHKGFIVMPFIRGQRLHQVVSTLPTDAFERINQIRSYCEQLIDILSLLDSIDTKIVHRDISPNNVMVDDNNQLYLIDFDRCLILQNSAYQNSDSMAGQETSSKNKNSTLQAITEGGTPGYQSIEVHKKLYDIDNRSDQYSVAALIFNLLSGESPTDNCGEVLQSQIRKCLSVRQRDYQEWIAPLSKAMSTNKEDRYASAKAFGVAILEAFDNYKSRIDTTPYQKASLALTQARDDVNDYAQLIEQAMGDIKGSVEHLTSIESSLSHLGKTQQTQSQKNKQKQSTKTQQDKSTQSNELHKQLLTSLKEITTNTPMADWLQTAQQIEGEVTQQQSDIKRYLSKLSRLEGQAKAQHNTQRQGSGTRQKTIQKQSKPQGLVDIEAVIADSPWSSIEKDVTNTLSKKEALLASHQALIPLLAELIPQIPLNNDIAGLTQAFATRQQDLRGLLLSYKEKQSSLRGTRAGKSDEVVTRLSTHIDNQQSDADGLEEKKASFEELHARLMQQVKALSQKLPPSFTPALAQTQNQAESTNADAQKTQSNSLNSVSLNELASILKQQQTHHANHSSLVQSYTSLVEHAWSKSYWQKEWKVAIKRRVLPVLLIGLGAASFAYAAVHFSSGLVSSQQISIRHNGLIQGDASDITISYPESEYNNIKFKLEGAKCTAQGRYIENGLFVINGPKLVTEPGITYVNYKCIAQESGQLRYWVSNQGRVVKSATIDVRAPYYAFNYQVSPSSASDAQIYINGRLYNGQRAISEGRYRFEVKKEGFKTLTLETSYSAQRPITFKLKPEYYSVNFDVKPDDLVSKVQIQGEALSGIATDVFNDASELQSYIQSTITFSNNELSTSLPQGRYRITANVYGYESISKELSVSQKGVDYQDGNTLKLKRITEPLIINTTPTNATIKLVNPEMTYQRGMPMPWGDYEVEVAAKGYESKTAQITIDSSASQFNIQLKGKTEELVINTTPADATVKIFNIKPEYTRGMRLPFMEYKIEISAEGYTPKNETVLLERGSGTFNIELDKLFVPKFVDIPAGTYNMGCQLDYRCSDLEVPRTEITVSPFRLMETEVTWAMYQPCIDAGVCDNNDSDGGDKGWGKENRPVINVSYNDIIDRYIPWLEKQTGERYRLPSEAEWEYAARGVARYSTSTIMTKYSWGNDIGKNKANCDGCGSEFDGEKTAPVATFDPNPFGLYDMHGNVWEWTQDCWNRSYYGRPQTNDAWEDGDCEMRMLRSGSFYRNEWSAEASKRDTEYPAVRRSTVGFRLAQDIDDVVRGPLTINTTPVNAIVKVLNIKSKYSRGMRLPVGEYEVKVSANGYETQSQVIAIRNENTQYQITLEKRKEALTAQNDTEAVGSELKLTDILGDAAYNVAGTQIKFNGIPAGKYIMGCSPNDSQCDHTEKPLTEITISPFRLMETEVTWSMYQPCIKAGVCEPNDTGVIFFWRSYRDRPVIQVSYNDIVHNYIPWLEKQTGEHYRLPSEAEWEYAARGVAGDSTNKIMTEYSWGDGIGKNKANCDGCGSEFDDENTAPVATFEPNAFGLYDMHGNVSEWTQDCWNISYEGRPQTNIAWETKYCSNRVMRGGAWDLSAWYVRASSREKGYKSSRSDNTGFRLAQDL